MKSSFELNRLLLSLDRKGYPAYKSLAGEYGFDRYTLCIDHVQGDPFASPSRLRLVMGAEENGFPPWLFDLPHKRTALEDQINRLFFKAVGRLDARAGGSGKSGLISISRCGQQVLKRTSVDLDKSQLTVRFEVGFPAAGRTILARELEKILFSFLPEIARQSMVYENLDKESIKIAIQLAEDQQAIRSQLAGLGICAFIANGAILPRESGISDKPLTDGIPFSSPASLEVTLNLPHKGQLKGMGIPQGITLVVGGGYHGKSTLLKALERGIYNHIVNDGREYVICDHTAMKIRAEDGRAISGTDISSFINHLPNGKDTRRFFTENASGSTSQAANVAEAVEAGSKLMLIDEDTSATNFMIRDKTMQALITPDKEPITPFTEQIRHLYEKEGLSTILVVGSSGTYFELADTVIQMDSYCAKEITEKAREVSRMSHCPECTADNFHLEEYNAKIPPLQFNLTRTLMPGSIEKEIRSSRDAKGGYSGSGRQSSYAKIKASGKDGFSINREFVDLRYVEQLVDPEQLMTLGKILAYADSHLSGKGLTLSQAADRMVLEIEKNGLSALAGSHRFSGSLAMVRKQEILACFNRLRTLKID